MRYSTQVQPISQLKARSAELLKRLSEDRQPLIITQNGEAKAVLQDIVSYEQQQETLALLKVLALGVEEIEQRRTTPMRDFIMDLKDQLKSVA